MTASSCQAVASYLDPAAITASLASRGDKAQRQRPPQRACQLHWPGPQAHRRFVTCPNITGGLEDSRPPCRAQLVVAGGKRRWARMSTFGSSALDRSTGHS